MWSFVHTVLLLFGLCIPAVDHDALNTEGKKHRYHLLYKLLQQASSSLCLVSSRCILGTETSFSTETDFWVTGSRMEDRVDKGAQIREMRKHLPWGLGLSQYVVQWYTLAALTPQRWFKQISQHNIKSEQFPCGVVVLYCHSLWKKNEWRIKDSYLDLAVDVDLSGAHLCIQHIV